MPKVDFVRQELHDLMPSYQLVRDCIEGETTIKKKGDVYLPRPSPADISYENTLRYTDYVTRAVFYNVTRRTLNGLVGQIFLRDPVIEVPALLDTLVKDANGQGVSLEQLLQMGCDGVLAFGRMGLLADYPSVQGPVTREQLQQGDIRPTLSLYEPWDVINWRQSIRGGLSVLSLVVLAEKYEEDKDGFEVKIETQYRVLKLEDNIYSVEIWRKGNTDKKDEGAFGLYERYVPTDGRGNTLSEIPFTFLGARNNDPKPDASPLYDLASINIAHYRNSADYEESCFVVGQPSLFMSGITQDWIENVWKFQPIYMGSRSATTLPVGGAAEMLQAEPNGLVKEAMEHKERQMVALGAKLVEQSSVQRTATEAGIEEAAENSVLASIAKNVASGFKWCTEWAAIFVGATTIQRDARDKIVKIELNTEFDLTKMSAEDRKQILAEWQAGAIAFEEMRASLRRGGIATLDDKEAKEKIDIELASAPNLDDEEESNLNAG